MRLIDAEELERVAVMVDGRLVVHLTDIHNAPTIEGFVYEDEYGMVGIDYKKVIIERTFKDEHGETCQVLHICKEADNETN